MKKCTQCAQTLNDDVKFCYKCGGGNFEPAPDAVQQSYQQPAYQQPVYQQPSYQQPAYQQPTYQRAQPGYQAQPLYNNDEPVSVGQFVLFPLIMCIPIFNIIYLIMVAVGGPKYKRSLTNYARAMIIWIGIGIVLSIIMAIAGYSIFSSIFGGGGYYNFY